MTKVEAGRVRVGQTITIPDCDNADNTFKVVKLQWLFRQGVVFYDQHGAFPVIPFKQEIEVSK